MQFDDDEDDFDDEDEWDDEDDDDFDDEWLYDDDDDDDDIYDEDAPRGKCKTCGREIVLIDWAKGLCDDCLSIAEFDQPAHSEEVTELKEPPWLTWAHSNPVS